MNGPRRFQCPQRLVIVGTDLHYIGEIIAEGGIELILYTESPERCERCLRELAVGHNRDQSKYLLLVNDDPAVGKEIFQLIAYLQHIDGARRQLC